MTANGTYVAMPSPIVVGENYKIYFPIWEKMTKAPSAWHTVIVVFGGEEAVVAVSRPKLENFDEYDFPEKSKLVAGQPADPEP